jgi:hypothetical protein
MRKSCQIFVSSSVIQFKMASFISPSAAMWNRQMFFMAFVRSHYITSCSLQNRRRIRRRRHSLIMWSTGCWNLFPKCVTKKRNHRLWEAWASRIEVRLIGALFCSICASALPELSRVRKPETLTAWLAANFLFRRAICSAVVTNRNVAVKIQSCL